MSGNKAITLSGFDPANPTSTFQVSDLPIPSPGAGQVVVKMLLRPVNPADIFSIMGVYPGFQIQEGATPIPGLEGVGVVEAVGEGVTKVTVGQRVVGTPFNTVAHGNGTWQQYIVANENNVAAVPDAVSDDAAAQFLVNPVTVVGLLEAIGAKPGEYVLQTAAGSVLGRQLIQVAKHKGIKTINVVRRRDLVDELKTLGADEVLVSDEDNIVEKVMEITGGKGAYGAVDCVGGDLFATVASAVRPGGTAIIYGAMSGLSASFSIPDPLFRGVKIGGFWLVPWLEEKAPADKQKVIDEVMALLAEKVVVPYSGTRFPLEQAAEAVAASTAAARGGKILLEG